MRMFLSVSHESGEVYYAKESSDRQRWLAGSSTGTYERKRY